MIRVHKHWFKTGVLSLLALGTAGARAQLDATNTSGSGPLTSSIASTNATAEQWWNFHAQNTDLLDYHPHVPARYSGPNSLSQVSEFQETVSLDLMAGIRLWPGAEFHLDGLMWQGYGFSKTLGIEAFPNSEGYRVGTQVPNVVFCRAFVRQNFGFGGEQEDVADDDFHLAGKQDISRVTVTIGKMSAKDVFDNNAYANDGRTQFMSWGLAANEAWDYPADSLGFMTGLAIELNQPTWTLRYGFFQVSRVANGLAQDADYLNAWAMVTEFEKRYDLRGHPGVIRFLAYMNRAHMGSYEETIDNPALMEDIALTREYRIKYGFGLNAEQELVKGVGAFVRLGWSDGHTESWMYSDVDSAASAGFSINGAFWHRASDTVGIAEVVSAASSVHQRYFEAGGLGILAGDGALHYGLEHVTEIYYDFGLWKSIHGTLDYQYVGNPAFNQDRGPVSVISARLHWHF